MKRMKFYGNFVKSINEMEIRKFDWSASKLGDIVVFRLSQSSGHPDLNYEYDVLGRVVSLNSDDSKFAVVEALYFKNSDESEYSELSERFKSLTGVGLNSGVTGGSTTRLRMDFCNFLDSVRDANDKEKEFVEISETRKKFGI